jgi:hypothetical protein
MNISVVIEFKTFKADNNLQANQSLTWLSCQPFKQQKNFPIQDLKFKLLQRNSPFE